MSGFTYPQPIYNSSIYNPDFYLSLDQTGYLTYTYAQTLYLSKNDYRLTYITGITPSIATAGVALVLGEDLSLSGLGAVSCSSLTVGGVAISDVPDYFKGITAGTAQASKALVLDSNRNISNLNDLKVSESIFLDDGKELRFCRDTASDDINSRIYSVDVANLTLESVRGGGTIGLKTNVSGSFTPNGLCWSLIDGGSSTRYCISAFANQRIGINKPTSTTSLSYQLDVDGSINGTSYYLGGSVVDISTIVGVTAGTAAASKALVVNASSDISGINSLAATSLSGTLLTVAQPNITSVGTLESLAVTGDITMGGSSISDLISASASPYLTVTEGLVEASKAIVTNASGRIRFGLGNSSTNCIQFYGGTAHKEIISMFRTSDDSGVTIGTTSQTIQRSSPVLTIHSLYDRSGSIGSRGAGTTTLLSMKWTEFDTVVSTTDNFTSEHLIGYYQAVPPWLDSSAKYHQFQTSMPMLNLAVGRSDTSTWATTNNLMLINDGRVLIGTDTPDPGSYQITIKPTSTYAGIALSGSGSLLKLTNNASATARTSILFESDNSYYQYSMANSGYTSAPANGLFWFNGVFRMVLTSNGRLGIGTVSPSCGLDVATSNSTTTTTNIAVNTYYYNISSNTHTNGGGGPFSATMCARFRSNVWIQDKIYATSDRRLKENIKPFSFDLSHYQKLNPVSYNWINQEETKLGLIAQELLPIVAEAVSLQENENMKLEQEGDVEGYQYTVNYNSINIMTVKALQMVIDRIDELTQRVINLDKSNLISLV